MHIFMRRLLIGCFVSFFLLTLGWSDDAFVIEDIRVEGLQRISAGTVFNYLPVKAGSRITPREYPEIIRALFKTGFFTDVNLERDGNVLVVAVSERPAIAEIKLTGNEDIPTDELTKSLEDVGLAEGRVFDRALLDKIQQELFRQYYARGKYAVKVDTTVQPLPRNRVAIDIDISEGVAARIRQIRIIGNHAFPEDELLGQFQLSTSGWLSILTKDDQYSKQKLGADIESLRSFYLDRGYLKFNVESTQVSITPNKKDIYITINVSEGDRYSIKDVSLAGDLIVPEDQLQALITMQPGDVFSRAAMTSTSTAITERLGDDGYAFANVNTVPNLDEATKQVQLTFVVDPGKRVYVRRINFSGNFKTHDEVLRREMRQVEGAWFSTEDVNRSRTRLERLGFLESVNVETPSVPGTTDQVDVDFAVTERASGNFVFGVGYGQDAGVLFNASLNQNNFLGTGKQLNLVFNNSQINTEYSIDYNNPYYTVDGISRGFRAYYRTTDAAEANVANYVTDAYGGDVNFGIPVSETEFVRTGFGIENIKVKTNDDTPEEIISFLDENGDEYLNYRLDASWSRDSRNRTVFADQGSLDRVVGELTLPGSGAEYYKLRYKHLSYFAITESLTLSLGGELGVGDGYGDFDELPFFENFYAGGLRTVRGYKSNTLGPRYADDDPSGGALLTVATAELLIPVPFLGEYANSTRLSGFSDVGNVFGTIGDFEANELRVTVGIAAAWLSPMGPLALSFAAPLNEKEGDEPEAVQFSFGVPF